MMLGGRRGTTLYPEGNSNGNSKNSMMQLQKTSDRKLREVQKALHLPNGLVSSVCVGDEAPRFLA